MESAKFSARWEPSEQGKFRVAIYKALFNVSPVVYRQHTFSDHRTLKAACRRLAHIIHRQGRTGYTGERFEAMYIITPNGERLPLRAAQARLT